MSSVQLALLMLAFLMVMMAIRIPIALAMLIVGATGFYLEAGLYPLLDYFSTTPYTKFSLYDLSVVPLFLLMGELATRAGITRELFNTCNYWIGHWKGGMAMASVAGCGAFGAICGSSLATASTMGSVALPEMKKLKYSGALASGSLAAGGTLGILIPPSLVLIIFSVLTEQNIAKMFLAAFLPGILAAIGYMIAIGIYVRLYPESGPAGERSSWSVRIRSLKDIWHIMIIFLIVLGGIYLGIFTPTEAAAIGVFLTGALAVVHGGLRLDGIRACILKTAVSTAMIFMIVLGADLVSVFVALTQLPSQGAEMIQQAGISPYLVLSIMLFSYFVFGCIMDSLSMILLTIPVYFPVIMGLDFGMPPEDTAIWFGILALVVVEVGLITPPVGMNVFIIKSFDKDLTLAESFRGVIPFVISDVIRVIILVMFPSISLVGVHLLQ